MSVTYPDLSYTQFPDKVDTIHNFIDVTLTTLPLAKQYYELYNSGDILGANQLLAENPDLKYSYIGADTLNPIVDSIKAMQLFYTQDVQNYLMNIVKYKGEYSSTVRYTMYNTVKYLHNSALEVFMCIKHDTPLGALPTDTNYWVPLTMRGERGVAGIGLSPHGIWNNLITYPKDAMVTYNNAIWGSLVENVGIAPSTESSTTWYLIMDFTSNDLTYTDVSTNKRYKHIIDNGNIYMEDVDAGDKIEVALLEDLPTIPASLPADGGTAETISSTLPISKGGTGATTVASALVNLGITATASELNKLDGVTATTTELNKLDGVTATTTELNKVHGLTPSTTELNYVKGVTGNIQTQLNGKANSSHSHTKSQVVDFPSSLPANGGNADTVDGFHFKTQTTIPTSLATNTFCFVYE